MDEHLFGFPQVEMLFSLEEAVPEDQPGILYPFVLQGSPP